MLPCENRSGSFVEHKMPREHEPQKYGGSKHKLMCH